MTIQSGAQDSSPAQRLGFRMRDMRGYTQIWLNFVDKFMQLQQPLSYVKGMIMLSTTRLKIISGSTFS